MPPSELRKEAREALAGKWGKGVCIILAYLLITFILGIVEGIFKQGSFLNFIVSIAVAIISIPLGFGLIVSFMKLKRGENTSAFDFLEDGFKNFAKAWKIQLWTLLKLLLPIICLIVLIVLMFSVFITTAISGENFNVAFAIVIAVLYIACIVYIIARSLLYVLAQYIAIDNPSLTAKECVLKSQEMMTGNRGNIFLLELSFIGWALLAVLTFGIGYLWLLPYMQIAFVCFYDRLKNK